MKTLRYLPSEDRSWQKASIAASRALPEGSPSARAYRRFAVATLGITGAEISTKHRGVGGRNGASHNRGRRDCHWSHLIGLSSSSPRVHDTFAFAGDTR